MSCTPPDSEGRYVHGMLVVLPGNYHEAAQVGDSHSPAFIQDWELRDLTIT